MKTVDTSNLKGPCASGVSSEHTLSLESTSFVEGLEGKNSASKLLLRMFLAAVS